MAAIKNPTKEYIKAWHHWHQTNAYGCNDPTWGDGVNMNLTRNHMIYYINHGAEIPSEMPLPPEVEGDYMARKDEIIENMRAALALYHQEPSFEKIAFIPKIRKDSDLEYYRGYIPGIVRGLESSLKAIERGEAIGMLPRYRLVLDRVEHNIQLAREKLAEMEAIDRTGEQMTLWELRRR